MHPDVNSPAGSEALVVFTNPFFKLKSGKGGAGTYNCQMLDFFFSASAGFSLDALEETTTPYVLCHQVINLNCRVLVFF